jgi:putative transposase
MLAPNHTSVCVVTAVSGDRNRRVSEYVEDKVEKYDIVVEQVDPENTSRRRSHCGVHSDNHGDESFECLKCGCQNHAGYNAKGNIGLRYLHGNQTGVNGGVPLGVRPNEGMLKMNGGYSHAENSTRTGVRAEPHRQRWVSQYRREVVICI